MTNYFNNLIARHSKDTQNRVWPRGRSRFEPVAWVSNDPGIHVPVAEEKAVLFDENNEEVHPTGPKEKKINTSKPNSESESKGNPKISSEPSIPDVNANFRKIHPVDPSQKNTPLPLPSLFSPLPSLFEKSNQDTSYITSEVAQDFQKVIDVKKLVTSRVAIQQESRSIPGSAAPVATPAEKTAIHPTSQPTQLEFVKPTIPAIPQNEFSIRRPSGIYQSDETHDGYLKEPVAAAPTIKIRIERIEVRAEKEQVSPPKKKREIARPNLSLDDYLKKQGK